MALNSKQQMKPYHKNPRRINKKQFEQLEENLLYLGDLSGIVHDLNSNEIIGGNQRSSVFDVSKCDIEIVHQYDYPDEQGTIAHGFIIWKDKRYTYRQVRWTPKQCEQANITANRLGGEWDFDELANWDMSDLLTWGFEEGDFPFDVAPALNEGADAEPQIDKAEELRQKWDVQSGQMWQLGEHRIIVGDCTDRAVVDRVMGGEKAELLFTSPPYADMREYSGNDLSLEMLTTIFPVWKQHASYFAVNLGIQYKNDEVYEYWDEWVKSAKLTGLKLLSWNVWDRLNATSVSSQLKMFAIQHEWVFVFGEKSKPINRTWEKSEGSKSKEKYYSVNGKGQKVTTRRQSDGSVKESIIGEIYDNKNMGTVFTGYAEMARDLDHPARFPLEFPSGYIGAMTNIGDVVAEPFSGSGTTLIACENLSRKCRAVEISPGYTSVAIQRWVDVTGKEPILLDA